MAKIKTFEEREKQIEMRRRFRTTPKEDKFISGVVKILKKQKIGNVTKSVVKNFIENYDFAKNEKNLFKIYEERFPKNINPIAGGYPKNALYALAFELKMTTEKYKENSDVSFKN